MSQRIGKPTIRSLPFAFVGVLSAVVILTVRLPHLEGWDDAFYVTQMLSLAGDGDLMLHDDLLAFENRNLATRLRTITETNPAGEGALSNTFGIGPAVIHSFYLWPMIVNAEGLPARLRIGYGLGSIGLLALTLLALRTLLIELDFGEFAAGACALAATYFGPLAIHGTRLQLNSHLPSAFCGVLVLLFAWRWTREGGKGLAVLLGLSCGLAAVVRFQDALVGLVLVPFLLTRVFHRTGERPKTAVAQLGLAAGAFIAVLSIQAIAFARQSGQILGVPQGPGYMNWTNPQMGLLLLSPIHGLIPWTPVFALGLIALAFAPREAGGTDKRWFFSSVALLVLVECYVSAVPFDWWGGSSFSARRLCSLTAAAAVGLATIARTGARSLILVGTLVALCWSTFVTSLYVLHFDDLRVVFTGQASPDSPLNLIKSPSPTDLRLPDLVRFVTGTFSLVDSTRPSIKDRAEGAVLCLLICVGAALLWHAFCASRRVRSAAAAVASVWTLVWLIAVWRAPSNLPANRAWLAIERGTATESAFDHLPAGVAASGKVLLAWRAVRAGRIEEGRRLLIDAESPHFPAVALTDLALIDESAVRRGDR